MADARLIAAGADSILEDGIQRQRKTVKRFDPTNYYTEKYISFLEQRQDSKNKKFLQRRKEYRNAMKKMGQKLADDATLDSEKHRGAGLLKLGKNKPSTKETKKVAAPSAGPVTIKEQLARINSAQRKKKDETLSNSEDSQEEDVAPPANVKKVTKKKATRVPRKVCETESETESLEAEEETSTKTVADGRVSIKEQIAALYSGPSMPKKDETLSDSGDSQYLEEDIAPLAKEKKVMKKFNATRASRKVCETESETESVEAAGEISTKKVVAFADPVSIKEQLDQLYSGTSMKKKDETLSDSEDSQYLEEDVAPPAKENKVIKKCKVTRVPRNVCETESMEAEEETLTMIPASARPSSIKEQLAALNSGLAQAQIKKKDETLSNSEGSQEEDGTPPANAKNVIKKCKVTLVPRKIVVECSKQETDASVEPVKNKKQFAPLNSGPAKRKMETASDSNVEQDSGIMEQNVLSKTICESAPKVYETESEEEESMEVEEETNKPALRGTKSQKPKPAASAAANVKGTKKQQKKKDAKTPEEMVKKLSGKLSDVILGAAQPFTIQVVKENDKYTKFDVSLKKRKEKEENELTVATRKEVIEN